eukprot:TRINITY_DN2051_c0_g1_i1.p1 TRINITY_DN2051_c0_g1~~TRINITY_DN2051_c0_g1_i1.p1  ORF type:complete len:676 (-),score=126.69 TRINITY_DN2051_c0_g1_i1:121-2052(-)
MSANEMPSDNLYVMGLPLDIDEQTLRQVFDQYGMVVQCKVLPPMEGKKERHAFVRFATVDEAANVRSSLSGMMVPKLQATVNIRFAHNKGGARAAAPAGGVGGPWGKSDGCWGTASGTGGGWGSNSWSRPAPYAALGGGGAGWGAASYGGGSADFEAPCDNLYISGLPVDIDDESVRNLFCGYGNVVQCKVLPPKMGQLCTVALVRYESEPEATAVKNLLNGNIPEGLQQPITIKYKAGEVVKTAGKGQPVPTSWPSYAPSSAPALAPPIATEEVACDNLYMKGLPLGIDEATIHQVFNNYGPVTSCRVLPSSPGATDSVALIRFQSVEVATWVKENLHGNVPQGFDGPVYIKYKTGGADSKGVTKGTTWPAAVAVPPPSRQPVAPPAYYPGSVGEGAPSDNLYVTGLPSEADEPLVKEVFGQYGTVLQVKVLPARAGQNDAVALVRYATLDEARNVKESLDGNIPEGLESPIGVRYKTEKTDTKGVGKADVGGHGALPYVPSPSKVPSSAAPAYPSSAGKVAGSGSGVSAMQVTCTGKMIAQGFEDSGALPGGSATSSDGGSVYVAGLPPVTEDSDLYRIFAPFGAIKVRGVKVLTNSDGTCKGIGFVNYIDPESADTAVAVCDGAQLPDGKFLKVSLKVGR